MNTFKAAHNPMHDGKEGKSVHGCHQPVIRLVFEDKYTLKKHKISRQRPGSQKVIRDEGRELRRIVYFATHSSS
jgi:hypothetical protein